jgi:uncharacterized lipoprotein YmbA
MNMIAPVAIVLLLTSCSTDNNQRTGAQLPAAPSQSTEPMERAVIVGSAEVPDPVLTRVRELEKGGVVQDVVVFESFPVQIQLLAPKSVVEELNKIPRVGGLR